MTDVAILGFPTSTNNWMIGGAMLSDNIRAEAVNLHKNAKWIYGLYGVLDGLSCSFTMLRFYFDARFANSRSSSSSSDMLHDWLITPEGFACLIIESIVVTSLAYVGNTKNNPKWDEDAAACWGYLRDGMKALKNGYRGVRNAIVFADMIALGQNLRYLVMPAGLLLGLISMCNRPWLTKMRKGRISAGAKNVAFISKWEQMVQGHQSLVNLLVEIKTHLKKQEQSKYFWLLAYLSAIYNGLLDAPNLYFGAVTLTILAPGPWILVAVTIFALACLVTRIYEEYYGQRELLITQARLRLACAENEDERVRYLKELNVLAPSSLSLESKLLVALTNGMDAHAALSSIMFAVSTICLLSSIPFPPALLVVWASMGMVCLVVPVVYEAFCHYCDADSKHVFFKEWFEICRSFFAGGNKGLRSMDFIRPSWEEADATGHYHATASMMPFAWILAALYAVSFALRNVAKLEKTTKADNSGRVVGYSIFRPALELVPEAPVDAPNAPSPP